MMSVKLNLSHACLLVVLLCHEAFCYPRGYGRGSSLTLVKRPSDVASSSGAIGSQGIPEDELEMALQAHQSGAYEPDFQGLEWNMGRNMPDSSQYFGLLERLVKKKDNQDQPKRTGGNRKFQTQGWR